MWPCGLAPQGRQDLRCNYSRTFSPCAALCFWVHEGMHALSGSPFVCLCPLCLSVSQSPPLRLKDADQRVAGSRRDLMPMCTRKWRIYTTRRTPDLQPQDGETASLHHLPACLAPPSSSNIPPHTCLQGATHIADPWVLIKEEDNPAAVTNHQAVMLPTINL